MNMSNKYLKFAEMKSTSQIIFSSCHECCTLCFTSLFLELKCLFLALRSLCFFLTSQSLKKSSSFLFFIFNSILFNPRQGIIIRKNILSAFFQMLAPLILIYFSLEDLFLLYTYFCGFWLYLLLPGFGFGLLIVEFAEFWGRFIYFLLSKIFHDPDLILIKGYYFCFYLYWAIFIISTAFRILFLIEYLLDAPPKFPNVFPIAYCMETDSEDEEEEVGSHTVFNQINHLVTVQSNAFFSGGAFPKPGDENCESYYKLAQDVIFYEYAGETDVPEQLGRILIGKINRELLYMPKDCFKLSTISNHFASFTGDAAQLHDYQKTVFETLLFKAYVNFIFFNPKTLPFIAEDIVQGANPWIKAFQEESFKNVISSITLKQLNLPFYYIDSFFKPINAYLVRIIASPYFSEEFVNECKFREWLPQILSQPNAYSALRLSMSAASALPASISSTSINDSNPLLLQSSSSMAEGFALISTGPLPSSAVLQEPAVSAALCGVNVDSRMRGKVNPQAHLETIVLKNNHYELLVSSLAKQQINAHNDIQTIMSQTLAPIPNFAQKEWNILTAAATYEEKASVDTPAIFHYNDFRNNYIPNLVVVYKSHVYPEAAKVNGNFELLTSKSRSCFEKLALTHENPGYYANFLRNMGFVTVEKPIIDSRAINESKNIVAAMELARFYGKSG